MLPKVLPRLVTTTLTAAALAFAVSGLTASASHSSSPRHAPVTVDNRTPNIPHPEHRENLPLRHSWTPHVLVSGSWKRIHSGLDRNTVDAGTILGMRYSARLSGDQRHPRHAPTLDDICGGTPGADLTNAAGVVIDFGRADDAHPDSTRAHPARMRYVCLTDGIKKTYQEAMTTAGAAFTDTKLCTVDSYPAAPCDYVPPRLDKAALAADLPALPRELPLQETSTMTASALEASQRPVVPAADTETKPQQSWLPLALVAAMLAAAALIAQRLIRV